jgi:hypothetical protein
MDFCIHHRNIMFVKDEINVKFNLYEDVSKSLRTES